MNNKHEISGPFLQDLNTGKKYPMNGRLITLGSGQNASIRLADISEGTHLAHFLFTGGTFHFHKLNKKVQMQINGKNVTSGKILNHGDKLFIGKHNFEYFDSSTEEHPNNESTPLDELINIMLGLLKNRDQDITASLMTAISRLLKCDAARIVIEDPQTEKRSTLIRYPSQSGLERFSNRAIDWAKDAKSTILMKSADWIDNTTTNRSLEINEVSSILCAPLFYNDSNQAFIYLDRIKKSTIFTEEDRLFCDKLVPLFSELLANSEEKRRQSETISQLQQIQSSDSTSSIIYSSAVMKKIMELAKRISPVDSPVLILGETGTGKEVMARYIHSHSQRADKPFKAINCGAIPENLMESELFGHEKGAFTGASSRKTGLFEAAQDGTVFLDEIGEMPLSLQVKLLRVLQESEISRVGGTDTIQVNARIIAATNRNLNEEINEGRFRSDLYFRINILTINLPPLRDRREDISLLVEFFITRYCTRFGLERKTITSAAHTALLAHSWPGNIRELENVLQKAVILCQTSKIDSSDLEFSEVHPSQNSESENPRPFTIRQAREIAEKDAISSTLRATKGNVSQASRLLEIDRKWLISKMEEYNILAADFKKA